MNRLPLHVFLILVSLFISACQRPFLADPEVATGAKWELVDQEFERTILAVHATPFEWYIISENQFARFDTDNKLLELRSLARKSGVLGIPALTDNTFVRLTTNDDAKQVVEFHLTRNPAEIHSILTDDLAGPADSFVEVTTRAHRLGAFSSDGTIFLLPIEVLPDRHFALLLFEVLHDPSHTSFTSIKVVKRIDLTDLSTDLVKLNSIRFLNGNFYVTSQEGAWRITPSGSAERIFPKAQWMLDVFTWQGDLYITGINTFDLHQSTDNGLTWERLNQNSALKLVTNANEKLFTQGAPGLVCQMVSDDFLNAETMILPEGYSPLDAIYYGAFFFEDKYYFSMGREVYFTEEVVVE